MLVLEYTSAICSPHQLYQKSPSARFMTSSYYRYISVNTLKTCIGLALITDRCIIARLGLLRCFQFNHPYSHSSFLQPAHHISYELHNSRSFKRISDNTHFVTISRFYQTVYPLGIASPNLVLQSLTPILFVKKVLNLYLTSII